MPSSCSCSGNSLLVGSTPTITMTFTDIDGDPATPTSITLRSVNPAGAVTEWTEADPEITGSGGSWSFTYPAPLTIPGDYWVYVTAEGGGADRASQVSFSLRDTHVPLSP